MPIAPPPYNDYVAPPMIPHDPPNAVDVVQAVCYEAQTIRNCLYDAGDIMPPDVIVAAVKYRASVVTAHNAGEPEQMPPWFVPAMQMMRRTEALVHENNIILLKNVNSTRGNGFLNNFEIMPFLVNVDDHRVLQQPTDAPHNLPALLTLAAITALTRAQSRQYFLGYYPHHYGQPPNHVARRERIARAIGAISLYE